MVVLEEEAQSVAPRRLALVSKGTAPEGFPFDDVVRDDRGAWRRIVGGAVEVGEQMFSNTVAAAVEGGVPLCVVVMGSTSGPKRALFDGSGGPFGVGGLDDEGGGCGLIGRCAASVFEAIRLLHEDEKSLPTTCEVHVKFVEFYDELLTDLLREETGSSNEVVHVGESDFDGLGLRGCSRPRVDSADAVARLLMAARDRRDKYAEKDSSMVSSAAYFEIELTHLVRSAQRSKHKCFARNKITFLEVPCTSKLKEARGALIAREGSTRNTSLFGFETACRSLATREPTTAVGGPSELSHLLADTLGGNALLVSVACLEDDDVTTLELQGMLTKVPQYPVCLKRSFVVGLLGEFRRRAVSISDVLKETRGENSRLRRALGGGKDEEAEGEEAPSMVGTRRRDLERELATTKLESARSKEDLAKVYKVLELFKQKYSELAEAKADSAKALLEAEQSRLEVSRALLETRTAAAVSGEAAEVDRYRTETDLLAVRDSAVDLEARLGEAQRQNHSLAADAAEVESLRRQKLESEQRFSTLDSRNMELSTELLSLVAQREDLSRKLAQFEEQSSGLAKSAATAQEDRDAQARDRDELISNLKETDSKLEALTMEHSRLQLELDRTKQLNESALLERDKAAAALAQRKDAEVAEAKKALDDSLRSLHGANREQLTETQKARGETKNAERRARDLEVERSRLSADLEKMTKDREAIATSLAELEGQYRGHLRKELNEAVVLKTDSAENLYSELVKTHTVKEDRLEAEIAEMKERQVRMTFRLRGAMDRARGLHDLLEDHAPQALPADVADEGEEEEEAAVSAAEQERAAVGRLKAQLKEAETGLESTRSATIAALEDLRRRFEEVGRKNESSTERASGLEKENAHLRELLGDLSSKLSKTIETQAATDTGRTQKKLASARKEVLKAGEQIAHMALSSPRSADLEAPAKLLLAQDENSRLRQQIDTLVQGDADGIKTLLADAEKRSSSLAYKNASLEEELRSYREYMKKTVKRFSHTQKDALRTNVAAGS